YESYVHLQDQHSFPTRRSSDLKENEISLSEEQFKSINVKLGSTETRSLGGNIKANGMLDVPPQNLVAISAPLGGFVKSTELLQGDRKSTRPELQSRGHLVCRLL